MTDLVHLFADHAAHMTYDALRRAAREAAKMSVLDTLGVILAASGMEPAVQGVIDIVKEAGGTRQSTLLAFGGKAPVLMAALANGALAHCLDYDDQTPWGQHCASSIVPAVFALAERRGGVSGRELITAVAVGQDIFARLRCNVAWKKDWNLSTVLAVYAATAAAGRVAGLSAAQIANAMGIASMQSSGIMEMVAGRGSDLRGLYAGFSAKGAVLAVLMAEKGISGIDRLFQGQYGVFASYFGGGYDRAAMVAGLGHDLRGAGTLYKRWQDAIDERLPTPLPPDDESPFKSPWVFGRARQEAILNLFSSRLTPQHSLVFFYCKEGQPLGDTISRLVMGVGKITTVTPPKAFEVNENKPTHLMWDLLIRHSIRPDGADGFLLPYHDYLEPTGDPEEDTRRQDLLQEIAVPADAAHVRVFSYAAELAPPDIGLSTLVRCLEAVRKIREHGIAKGPWERREEWLNEQIAQA